MNMINIGLSGLNANKTALDVTALMSLMSTPSVIADSKR